ncbi:DUF2680 domain-containing protein [Oscillospiraceae bacterium PP1C4]
MKLIKKSAIITTVVAAIALTSVSAFAASTYSTPAEAVAGLTGRTTESVIAERTETDKTYGTIANDAGKLAEFKKEVLEIKKDALSARVAAGQMTQEQADAAIKAIEENQLTCDGTGSARNGMGGGCGLGNGQGKGMGGGRGFGGGLRDGSCLTK